jgi:hypothetical protein
LMTASHGAACRLAGAEPLPPFDNSQPKWAEPTSLPGVSNRSFAATTCALCNRLNEKTQDQISYLETGVACTQRFIGRRNAGQIIFFWMGAMGDPGI